MRKKVAILVAAGKGLRMNEAVPKQFLTLLDKPLLYYPIRAFWEAYEDMQIILVLPEKSEDAIAPVLKYFPGKEKDIYITTGGANRFESVQNGLKLAAPDSVIFVHDGVRPLVTVSLIRSCFEQAVRLGSAIPSLPLKDSIRQIKGQMNVAADRTGFHTIQTPQTFLSEILTPAFQQLYRQQFTDEATVVEKAGTPVHLIAGDEENIKITRPFDLVVAGQILLKRSKP